MRRYVSLFLAFIFMASCSGGPKKSADTTSQKLEYASLDDARMEQCVCDYVYDALSLPLEEGRNRMEELLWEIEREEKMDSSSHVFLRMTELVSKYLYDPNSPMRDEDLYYPFVKGLVSSEYTSEDMRTAYTYEASMCALNPRGSVAADFRIKTSEGKIIRLHDIQAQAVVLFFSNPGCNACAEIIEELKAVPYMDKMIEDKLVAVVSVYVDEDLDSWREHIPDYPASWIVGYDADFIIRGDVIYNVRAIPSLYLLDNEKKVVLKDAPTQRLVSYIVNGFLSE